MKDEAEPGKDEVWNFRIINCIVCASNHFSTSLEEKNK